MFGCNLRCTCETAFAINEVAPCGTRIVHLKSSHWIWLHFRNILCHAERQWKHHKQRADHGQLELFWFNSPWASKIALKSMAAGTALNSNCWVAQCENSKTERPQLYSRTSKRDKKNTNTGSFTTCSAVPAVLRTAQALVMGCGQWDIQGFPIFVFIIVQYSMVKAAQKGAKVRNTQRSFSAWGKSLRVWKYWYNWYDQQLLLLNTATGLFSDVLGA